MNPFWPFDHCHESKRANARTFGPWCDYVLCTISSDLRIWKCKIFCQTLLHKKTFHRTGSPFLDLKILTIHVVQGVTNIGWAPSNDNEILHFFFLLMIFLLCMAGLLLLASCCCLACSNWQQILLPTLLWFIYFSQVLRRDLTPSVTVPSKSEMQYTLFLAGGMLDPISVSRIAKTRVSSDTRWQVVSFASGTWW